MSGKIRYTKDIYKCSFTSIDRVTLCLTNEAYTDTCAKYNYETDFTTDGLTTRLKHEGRRGNCIIGIQDAFKMSKLDLMGILTHEITHAVDFIMEDQGFIDMEMRAYMAHDMMLKSLIFIKKQKKRYTSFLETEDNKKDSELVLNKYENDNNYPRFIYRLNTSCKDENKNNKTREVLLDYIKHKAIPHLDVKENLLRQETFEIIKKIELYKIDNISKEVFNKEISTLTDDLTLKESYRTLIKFWKKKLEDALLETDIYTILGCGCFILNIPKEEDKF